MSLDAVALVVAMALGIVYLARYGGLFGEP